MKKALGTILAVAMLASMATVANAKTITVDGATDSADVNAQYVAGTDADTVYSVDVAWDSMAFTYTAPSKGTWDPGSHGYIVAEGTSGTWDGEGTIAVTNHSNAPVSVALEYTATDDDIAGSFDKASFDLATADGTAVADAPTGSAELTLSGELADTYTTLDKVGEVTVTISE